MPCAVLACLLGMASKEVMVSAPLMVLLYDRTFLAGSFREAWRRRYGLYLALAGTWLLLGWLVICGGQPRQLGRFWHRGRQLGVPLHAVWGDCSLPEAVRLAAPAGVRLRHGHLPITLEIVPYAVVVGLLGLATLVALWRWPKVGFLGAWFFAILAPTPASCRWQLRSWPSIGCTFRWRLW